MAFPAHACIGRLSLLKSVHKNLYNSLKVHSTASSSSLPLLHVVVVYPYTPLIQLLHRLDEIVHTLLHAFRQRVALVASPGRQQVVLQQETVVHLVDRHGQPVFAILAIVVGPDP